MTRRKTPKKAQVLSQSMWNNMWKLFCPWVMDGEVAPIPVYAPRRRRIRQIVGALAVFGLMTGANPVDAQSAMVGHESGHIVLAALNNTVPASKASLFPNLFGATEQRHGDIRPFTKWTGVLERFKADFSVSLKDKKTKKWMKFLSSLKDATDEEKIEAVNAYMNKVRFVSDANNYGVRDYWATPMEFLARGGDCEDYAMAKYISLRALGFSQDKMRLAIVYDHVMRMPHAVLVVYHGEQALILDNQNPSVMASDDITRYKPIYSISQVAWWRH